MLLIVLMIIPDFSQILYISLYRTKDLSIICITSDHEKANWTQEQLNNFSEILKIVVKCNYYKYNNYQLNKMTNTEAANFFKNEKIRPVAKYCKDFIILTKDRESIFSEFSLICDDINFVLMFSCLSLLFNLLLGIIILPTGDILGKKRIIIWGKNCIFVGTIAIFLAVTPKMLFFGCILAHSGNILMRLSMQITLTEITADTWRPTLYCLACLGCGISQIIRATVLHYIRCYWRYLELIVSAWVLVLPLVTWYFPESPRWYGNTEKKEKAWSFLRTLKDPARNNELVLNFRNEKLSCGTLLEEQLKDLGKLMESRRFINSCLVYLMTALLTSYNLQSKTIDFGELQFTYEILSGVMTLCSCILPPPLLFPLDYKISLTVLTILTSLFYFLASVTTSGSFNNLMAMLGIDLFSKASFLIAGLHLIQSVPMSHRCTVLGLVALSFTSSELIVFMYLIEFMSNFVVFITLGFFGIFVSSATLLIVAPIKDPLPETVEDLKFQNYS